jgi:hypothetical protein
VAELGFEVVSGGRSPPDIKEVGGGGVNRRWVVVQ